MTTSRTNTKKEPLELVSYGNLLLPPVVPNSEVSDLCQKLDDFYSTYPSQHKRQKASDLIKGAFYAIRQECRSNPDWMSQAANSARDVLYPLFSSEFSKTNLIKLFSKYAINRSGYTNNKDFIKTFALLDEIYKKLTDIAHHGTNLKVFNQKQYIKFSEKDFEELLEEFALNLKRAFSLQQIYIHTVIESILKNKKGRNTIDEIDLVLGVNPDARQFFFSKADEKCLGWLWQNGFLDTIKDKASDTNSYGFRMPELNYLVSVTEKKPDIVTNIICSFEITTENFNPEVVDQFTRICSKLPARCLKKLVKKIRDEKWIGLMGKYTQYGFEYADMFKTLHNVGDFESILALAEAILLIRSKKEFEERKNTYRIDDIFYIHDLSETRVFNYLIGMANQNLEKALSIAINTFSEAIKDESNYILMDEDFFTLSLDSVSRDSFREAYKLLAATIVEITRKMFTDKKNDKKVLYEKYFAELPKNQITRRLKLFVLSLDPKLFIDKLESEYFRLFETENKLEILYGAEYERALKAGFQFLTNTKKHEYVKKAFDIFSDAKDEDDKKWKRHYASCILSTISEHLTDDEVALAKENDFKIDPKYQPEPSIGRIRGGTVTPRSPISKDDFASYTIEDIADKLKGELSPGEIQKRYSNDDFLNPRDADGVAEQLKGDIKNRLVDYLNNATLFFDRDKLIPHYTNAYLREIKDALSESRGELGDLNYEELLKLLLAIKESGEKEPFSKTGKDSEGRWLSSWNSVHSTIADLIEELIKQKDKKTLLNFKKYRERVLEILEYLLNFNDPIPEDEKLKTAKSTIKHPNEAEYSISDPFTIAINSVRGRTFQILLHFIYQDASNFDNIRLADDVKTIYDNLLEKEDTRAIMFMYGHYLPSFHFRDMEWIRSKFGEIFESSKKDKYLRLAVWEGYLSNNLYKELFFEPFIQKLYSKNITLILAYPKQKFFKDPHESLAIHFALAFVHYEEFDFSNKLFKKFLAEASTKQLSEFISFLGRSYVAGENYNVLKDQNFTWRIKRVKDFWDLMLKTKNDSPSLKEFGTWIEVGNNVFEVKWLANKISQTLGATNGELKWDYGLIKSIEKLAADSPHDALKILEKHFLSAIEKEQNSFPIQADKEWYNAFKILYGNKDVKSETYSLINKLIEKGGRQFWRLEDIVKNNADE